MIVQFLIGSVFQFWFWGYIPTQRVGVWWTSGASVCCICIFILHLYLYLYLMLVFVLFPTLVLRLHTHTESGCWVVDQSSLCQLRSVNLTIRLQDPAAICLCVCICVFSCFCICIIVQCLCQLHTDYLTIRRIIRKCTNCWHPNSYYAFYQNIMLAIYLSSVQNIWIVFVKFQLGSM